MHADALLALAAARGRDLEAAAARARLRPAAPRPLLPLDRLGLLLRAWSADLRPRTAPVSCCA